jgi:hypothetical protein
MTSEEIEEIKSQIVAIRAQLGADLDQLAKKINPGRVAARTAHEARAAAGNAVAVARGRAEKHPAVMTVTRRAADGADHAVGAVRDQMEAHPGVGRPVLKAAESVGQATHTVRENARRNPGAAAVVLGVAILVPFVLAVGHRRRGRYNLRER